MNILFWNLNKKNLIKELVSLSDYCDADIIAVAENETSDSAIIKALNYGRDRKYCMPFNASEKIDIYTRYNYDDIESVSDDGGISIRKIQPPLGIEFILVAVHLPSKLHRSKIDQTMISVRLSQVISEAEGRIGHDRTIVIGDFNMNPFEDGLVSAEGLHAVMDRNIAQRKNRIVQGEVRNFFYNPMWSLLGDLSIGPPGTYHYQSSGQVCFFWNAFDQVLVRPSLLEYFSNESIKIITQTDDFNFVNCDGRPKKNEYSDHLPISIHLKIEEA